ncbi:CNP1-like family protein [Chromobacterium alticapitis]|uniref:CNP1-like family protein n=1 Tax=Chromobacterium alticapitis TaxID=2073169 RepID=UPI001304876E|nr:CNP1-like family protein [Chromobacterium alticapitis]
MNFRPTLPALLALCLSLTAHAENKQIKNDNYAFDNDKPWEEQAYALPDYPQAADWLEVKPDWLQQNRFYVDAKTLSVGGDGVVRFVSRVRSPSGVENLSVEGIQCKDNRYKAYAFGDDINHRWIASMAPQWQDIAGSDKLRRELRALLCPYGSAPRDAAQAVESLRKGG